jgi:hypothetical protein
MADSSACACDGSAGSTARYTCVQSARVPPWLPTVGNAVQPAVINGQLAVCRSVQLATAHWDKTSC